MKKNEKQKWIENDKYLLKIVNTILKERILCNVLKMHIK